MAVVVGGLVLASCGGGGSPEPTLRTFAYVANDNSGDVSIFRVDEEGDGTLHPIGRVNAGARPLTVAIHPLGQYAYAVNVGSDSITAYKVDPATGMLSAIGSAATGRSPFLLQFHPSGRFAFGTNSGDGSISTYVVDQTTGILTASATVQVGEQSTGLAVHPSGKFLYVEGADQLFAFGIRETGELSLINSVAAGTAPEGVFINPAFGFVHVMGDASTATSHAIDPTSGAVAAASSVSNVEAFSVRSTAIDPTGRLAYVANVQATSVLTYAINSTTGELTLKGTLPTGPNPNSAAISPSGRFVYVPNSQDNTVSAFKVDQATGLLSTTGQPVPAGDRPFSITIASFLH